MNLPFPTSTFVAVVPMVYHARAQERMDISIGAAAPAVIVVCIIQSQYDSADVFDIRSKEQRKLLCSKLLLHREMNTVHHPKFGAFMLNILSRPDSRSRSLLCKSRGWYSQLPGWLR